MINAIPPGERDRIHIIGRSQGYRGVAVHFGTVIDPVSELETPCLTTAWTPTPEQLAKLNAGGNIVLQQINITQLPPMLIDVSEPPAA